MNTRLVPVLVVAFLVLACADQQSAPHAPPSAASSTGAAAATAQASLPEPIAVAMGRVRGMLDAVDDAKIKEAFTHDFLASVPPPQVAQTFTEVSRRVGACSGQQPLAVKGTTEAHVRITCEHGQVDAKLVVDAGTPYMIEGLLIRPLQD